MWLVEKQKTPISAETLTGAGHPVGQLSGRLTALGDKRAAVPWGKPWDSHPSFRQSAPEIGWLSRVCSVSRDAFLVDTDDDQQAHRLESYFRVRSKKSRVIRCNWREATPVTPWVFCG